MNRKVSELQREIVRILKKKKRSSLSSLELELGTWSGTIKDIVLTLEDFQLLKIRKHSRHPVNGRPYTTAEITSTGRKARV